MTTRRASSGAWADTCRRLVFELDDGTTHTVVRSDEKCTAILARGRGFLIYWVPAGHNLVLLERLVWAG